MGHDTLPRRVPATPSIKPISNSNDGNKPCHLLLASRHMRAVGVAALFTPPQRLTDALCAAVRCEPLGLLQKLRQHHSIGLHTP